VNGKLFVIPFAAGFFALLAMLGVRYCTWLKAFPGKDRRKILSALLGPKLFGIIGEVFPESLLHRRIFKVNPVLGWMHMSFAFGWFLLIVFGTLEAEFHSGLKFHAPWDGVFFKYFVREPGAFPFAGAFSFIMDFLLAVLLAGLLMAFGKRFYSRLFGMKKTTRQRAEDRLALAALWMIFPLRYLSHSITSALCDNGGFLTGTTGHALAQIVPAPALQAVETPAWWAYSISLGLFFVALPFSRYMHIPTEVLLIILRHAGLKSGSKFSVFHEIEVSACPRCGICIDKCQMNKSLGLNRHLPVYFLHSLRHGSVSADDAFNCLQCGRCKEFCPVVIDTVAIRDGQREALAGNLPASFDYLPATPAKEADVIYFAGCMTHLTPAIKKAMVRIMDAAGVFYEFMDRDGSICCGKPMMEAGNHAAARELANKNIEIIRKSNARTMVTSCPICYRVFRDEYDLDIRVLHHSEYIAELLRDDALTVERQPTTVTYHDPCELGRLSGVYEAPREVLEQIGSLHEPASTRERALCCGGSIANLPLDMRDKDRITRDALQEIASNGADALITACPLCKKTFAKHAAIPVKDIAEVVADSLTTHEIAISGGAPL
jgi:Fe-S oxidoreductase